MNVGRDDVDRNVIVNVLRVEHTLNCFVSFNTKEKFLYSKQSASENYSSYLIMIYARH